MAVPGSVVGVGKLITPGGQQGPKGDAGTAANVPLADITQNGLLRKTSGNTTDFTDGTNNYQPLAAAIQPTIWSARLRSFNAIGNPNFEVDQRKVGTATTANGQFVLDRWQLTYSGTMALSVQQANQAIGSGLVPGTGFQISSKILAVNLTTSRATLGATDQIQISQTIEGIQLRELINDVHSLSILAYTNVAGGLKFSIYLSDNPGTKFLAKLCTIPQGQWTLVSLPNLPVWPSGNFAITPGAIGYILGISLTMGSNYKGTPDVWQSTGTYGATGMDDFASKPNGSNFFCGFVQHEPGPQCSTTLIDKPFSQNLDECLRYYCKSAPYGVLANAAQNLGAIQWYNPISAAAQLIGSIAFKKVMAKAPTVISYSVTSGAANTIRNQSTGADMGVLSVFAVGDAGFAGFNLGSAPGITSNLQANWAADTGW